MAEQEQSPKDIKFRIPGLNYNAEGDDLLPSADTAAVLAWAETAFQDAYTSRKESENRWFKYYKMYRSWAGKRNPGDWRSRVWIPLSFYVVETIVPRLVAQLPKLTVEPVGPDDAEGAKAMEYVLDYVTEQSDLYLELVKAFRSAMIYGTGILKTMYEEKYATSIQQVPEMTDQMMDMPTGQLDIDGNEQMTTVTVGQIPTGKTITQRQEILKYAGPGAEAVDIFNFFVSPEAEDIDDASYVIHRVYRTRSHVERLMRQGAYHVPEDINWEDLTDGSGPPRPAADRLGRVGLDPGSAPQNAKGTRLIELREIWTDDVVLTVAGGRYLIRAAKTPYAHNEKPFVRIVDHMVQHEFWGIGELEPLEGIQDTMNALWNSRIDNVKLVLNQMFAVSTEYLEDINDLKMRPGGVIRLREGVPIDQAIKPIELGEVTQSSYTEAAEMERLSEKVTGVSAYQMGTDSPSLNRTATGVALISEQGNTRFAHKVRISELTGLRRLARHFGSVLQQFMPENFYVRIAGPGGQFLFQSISPESIAGAFDYNIEAESASQTESMRREQTLSLFGYLSAMPEINRQRLIEDVLQTFGRKDIQDYLNPAVIMQEQMQQQQMMMAMQQGMDPSMMQGGMGASEQTADQSGGTPGGAAEQQGPPEQAG